MIQRWHCGPRLRKVYLGRSADLTAERLQEAAELLAGRVRTQQGVATR